jgi:hypothetical protein
MGSCPGRSTRACRTAADGFKTSGATPDGFILPSMECRHRPRAAAGPGCCSLSQSGGQAADAGVMVGVLGPASRWPAGDHGVNLVPS